MSDDKVKDAIKEAIHEWIDEKYKEFGKWAFKGVLAMAFAGIVYLFLTLHGWKPPVNG